MYGKTSKGGGSERFSIGLQSAEREVRELCVKLSDARHQI